MQPASDPFAISVNEFFAFCAGCVNLTGFSSILLQNQLFEANLFRFERHASFFDRQTNKNRLG